MGAIRSNGCTNSAFSSKQSPSSQRYHASHRPGSGSAALDSFGGGFIGAAPATLCAVARVMTVLSHFVVAWLARRIGLVNTMVFTHLGVRNEPTRTRSVLA
ncbi:MAG TPA: hypothetical protein VMG60_12180 [Burkholderiaceae bacterium]|nr:hypothetical protein [Burkholderiaceae bacterium]